MKSNRKFLAQDKAVSPVIGVILMVAVTVVLAATVYVWASGFGANTTQPARSIAASKSSPYTYDTVTMQNFTINSASSNLKYQDIQVTVDGKIQSIDTAYTCAATESTTAANAFAPCGMVGSTFQLKNTGDLVQAGDLLHIRGSAGSVVRIIDAQANSVLATYTFG